ncbi:OmpA family protein [Pseudidiomarina sp. WS423]|uniref:OmpA family protein n=1 Tax=Pseudidiomarina sp. WS423 TaxID=3425124 RepID=UPI003D6EEA13
MKRLTLLSVAVASALLSAPVFAQASNETGRFYVGPRIGMFGTDSDRVALERNQLHTFGGGFDAVFGGLEAGFQFTPEWGYRVYYDYLRGDLETTDSFDSSGNVLGIDVVYNFTEKFYGAAGINATELGNVSNQFLRLSAGYREYLTDDLALTVEGALQQSDGDLTEFMFLTSLRWYFGGNSGYSSTSSTAASEPAQAAPVAPVVVADSDNDGVNDNLDKCPNTQAGYVVDADGCVKYENEVVKRDLIVNFAINSATIAADQKADIKAAADFLKQYPQLDITVEGYTDSSGPATFNQQLSERRAKAVGDALINDYGIAAERVTTVGYGESKPRYPNDTRENRIKNRRIEAHMKVTKKVPVTE